MMGTPRSQREIGAIMSTDSPDWISTQTPEDLAAEGDAQANAIEELAADGEPDVGDADPDDEALLDGGEIP